MVSAKLLKLSDYQWDRDIKKEKLGNKWEGIKRWLGDGREVIEKMKEIWKKIEKDEKSGWQIEKDLIL